MRPGVAGDGAYLLMPRQYFSSGSTTCKQQRVRCDGSDKSKSQQLSQAEGGG